MNKTHDEIIRELGSIITFQYDYPATGEGWVGYKGHNMYRFKAADAVKIKEYFNAHIDEYMNEFNMSTLAQELISDLLDEGLITYGGYGYKDQQRKNFSI